MLYDLEGTAAAIVNNPANYQLVQHLLDVVQHEQQDALIWKGRDQYNGFFFALSSRVKHAAFSEELLFDPSNYNFDQVLEGLQARMVVGFIAYATPLQELDLSARLLAKKMTICVHKGAFVYHFKGQTIPIGVEHYHERRAWRRADGNPHGV